jgi:quercetin dioxygenase-like cupin family protein
MKRTTISLVLLYLMTSTVTAQEPDVVQLMSKNLKDNPGKEVSMMTVTYPPGWSDPVHRHNAQGFIYVLEGSVVMQVKGGKEVTLTPGQTFYEGPDDIHIVGRNASKTMPAKFLVFLVKEKGAPALVFQLPTSLAASKPITMSVSRDKPRHMTIFPGGESLARPR